MKATTFDLSRVFDPRPYRDVSPATIEAVRREAEKAKRAHDETIQPNQPKPRDEKPR